MPLTPILESAWAAFKSQALKEVAAAPISSDLEVTLLTYLSTPDTALRLQRCMLAAIIDVIKIDDALATQLLTVKTVLDERVSAEGYNDTVREVALPDTAGSGCLQDRLSEA